MQTQSLPPVKFEQFATASKAMAEHNGIAALYDVEIDRGFYMMEIAQKAFAKSTGEPNKILILNQHYSAQPIGRAAKFDDGKDALRMDFLLNTEVQTGKEVDSNIRNGVLTGLSVGFDVIKVETEKRGGEGAKGYEVDRVVEARLREVSVVSWPAIDGARINASDSTVSNAVTFAVNDGDSPREHLQEGDCIQLATFFSPGKRIRPNPSTENDTLAEVQPQEIVELTDDEKYPGAREALERILNGDIRR